MFCADVGSIKKNRFGWAAALSDGKELGGTGIEEFALTIANGIKAGKKVSIGFECPLFVPVRSDPQRVNSARNGEGNRSWSAGAGTAALATGLVEVLWVMNRINTLLRKTPKATVKWTEFTTTDDSVFLWEAFVTSTSKGNGHSDDARIAVNKFKSVLPDPSMANAIKEDEVLSLVGAAALRAGWSTDVGAISEPCLVIRA